MLVKSSYEQEKKKVEEIIASDAELNRQHELFKAEMAFKQEMINARKAQSLTQKDVSRLSGLSQQAISRIENGASGTICTVIRYLDSIGYSLSIKKN
ncbi:helix-turn-helix domain-containing protein [Butyrivibrio sp. INlla14]|uniref:helix-turn-helix domain-containing protein n=1 Tax=Butyrivibrio sp. INlla14 TaxID=1520808 RepID=UPI0008769D24|nr:helix-turn-helix domain-containing protein [Butyrivibrio sp. INlla14]SCY69624.1 Helix-turn-helix [Butyrivibrio sp. INlla14]